MISRRYMTWFDIYVFWFLTILTIFGGLIYWAWWSTRYTLWRNGPDRAAVLAREAAIDQARAEYRKDVVRKAKIILIPVAGFLAVFCFVAAVLR
jgi:hypothetical protein